MKSAIPFELNWAENPTSIETLGLQPLVSSAQMREADSYAIQTIGITSLVLMEHAALAVFTQLKKRFKSQFCSTKGWVFCGGGNNGGDGLAVARLAFQSGCEKITIVLLSESLSPDAQKQLAICEKLGIPCVSDVPTVKELKESDWFIDALFGTGLTRDVEGTYAQAINRINHYQNSVWTISADIPSGLCADTGAVLGSAVHAAQTVTFGFVKRGLVTNEANNYVGRLVLAPIQIPKKALSAQKSTGLKRPQLMSRGVLAERDPVSHKGDYGHVFVIGGTSDTLGASVLSTRAALSAGAGLVTWLGDDVSAIRNQLPVEIMTATSLEQLKKASTIIVGPGFGTDKQHWDTLKQLLVLEVPIVLDADAITLLQKFGARELIKARSSATVITPHPKEAARLLEKETSWIQEDRYRAVAEIAESWACICVLKGSGTLVGGVGMPTIVVRSGDAGLAKGGSGDVLAGIIGGFLAQKYDPFYAACFSVFIHGRCSQLITQRRGQQHSTTASDVIDQLPEVLRQCRQSIKSNR